MTATQVEDSSRLMCFHLQVAEQLFAEHLENQFLVQPHIQQYRWLFDGHESLDEASAKIYSLKVLVQKDHFVPLAHSD